MSESSLTLNVLCVNDLVSFAFVPKHRSESKYVHSHLAQIRQKETLPSTLLSDERQTEVRCFLSVNLPCCYHVCISKCLSSYRDDFLVNICKTTFHECETSTCRALLINSFADRSFWCGVYPLNYFSVAAGTFSPTSNQINY